MYLVCRPACPKYTSTPEPISVTAVLSYLSGRGARTSVQDHLGNRRES